MRATIKDIAKRVGLSTTTVSLVLNNRPNRISDVAKKAILAAAEELDYRPSQIAVSMVTKRTDTIGLILPDIGNLYFSELAKIVEEACSRLGYNVIYGNTNDSVEKDFRYLELFLSRNVDAILITPSVRFNAEQKDRFKKLIDENDLPVVTMDRPLPGMDIPCVCVDQELGGYMATHHLISLGHRRIGCITASQHITGSGERLKGYCRALEEAGIPFDESLVVEGDYRVEGGIRALPTLLGQGATAVFAENDMMAIGVYRECHRFHVRIPEDLSVVGFDDIFLAEFLEPPLTTIYQPLEKIGREAVREAVSQLQEKQPRQGSITAFQPALRIRGSAAKVKTI